MEFFHNTQSYQRWHLCATNINELETVENSFKCAKQAGVDTFSLSDPYKVIPY